MIKNVKREELTINIVIAFLNMQTLKDDLIKYKCFRCNNNF